MTGRSCTSGTFRAASSRTGFCLISPSAPGCRSRCPLAISICASSPRRIVLLASGTGFCADQVDDRERDPRRQPAPDASLLGRALPRRHLLFELPVRWQERLPWFSFTPVLSEPSSSWTGRTGLVHDAVREDHSSLEDFDVYACGNPLMVTAAQNTFTTAHHLPDAQFFADAFVASGPLSSDKIQPAQVQS